MLAHTWYMWATMSENPDHWALVRVPVNDILHLLSLLLFIVLAGEIKIVLCDLTVRWSLEDSDWFLLNFIPCAFLFCSFYFLFFIVFIIAMSSTILNWVLSLLIKSANLGVVLMTPQYNYTTVTKLWYLDLYQV